MNRIIKFRAWDKEEKEMIDANSFALINIDEFEPLSDVFESLQEHFVLMQYTGFNDRNDNEIYEGDILNCMPARYDLFDNLPEEGSYLSKVEWIDNFILKSLDEDIINIQIDGIFIKESEVEIVGNIYENPELMEKNNV